MPEYSTKRPNVTERKFISDAVEDTIKNVVSQIDDRELAWMFENCFPNTLDTTVQVGTRAHPPDTFVITGDITAMWLRDSTAQVWPYLPLAQADENLRNLLAGVIHRQTACVRIDPYANAFNYAATGSVWGRDRTTMKPELHERKWEVDSLCYVIRLAYGYWKHTRDTSCFDEEWQEAMALIVKTFREQQRFNGPGPYTFQREDVNPYDSAPLSGYGNPTRPCGLIHSLFRPSDDACIYPFLIPSNLFAIVSLTQLAEIYATVLQNHEFAATCTDFAREIQDAVRAYAIVSHCDYGEIYAYEVDGFGNRVLMDDANIPSLLSLPYLNYCPLDDEIYVNTRHFVLSKANPYFFQGAVAEGIGGPHVGIDMIWPMSIIMRALTSTKEEEILTCLNMLKKSHAGTGFMHESFHKDDPNRFTRSWFAWANTLFGELILKIFYENPALLKNV